MLQAYIDDSSTPDGVFALGGHVSTPERWSALAREWAGLLRRFGTLGADGKYRFKRSQMMHRVEDMAPFFRVIEENVLFSVSCSFRLDHFYQAFERIFVTGLDLDVEKSYLQPFRFATFGLMHALVEARTFFPHLVVSEDIQCTFDSQSEQRLLLSLWDTKVEQDPLLKSAFGRRPKFADDDEVLPLQAADFWVG